VVNHLFGNTLALGVLLGHIGNVPVWFQALVHCALRAVLLRFRMQHTRGKGLLQLVGLLIVVQDKGVEETLASDLELDVVGLLALLDASGGSVLALADLKELNGAKLAQAHIFLVLPVYATMQGS
jgi:hypothetical protein